MVPLLRSIRTFTSSHLVQSLAPTQTSVIPCTVFFAGTATRRRSRTEAYSVAFPITSSPGINYNITTTYAVRVFQPSQGYPICSPPDQLDHINILKFVCWRRLLFNLSTCPLSTHRPHSVLLILSVPVRSRYPCHYRLAGNLHSSLFDHDTIRAHITATSPSPATWPLLPQFECDLTVNDWTQWTTQCLPASIVIAYDSPFASPMHPTSLTAMSSPELSH